MNIIIVCVIIILCTLTINNTIITLADKSKPRNIFDDYIKSMQEIYRLRLEAYDIEKQDFLNELSNAFGNFTFFSEDHHYEFKGQRVGISATSLIVFSIF